MKMSVGVLDHYNVLIRKLDETVHFYETVLGFTNGPRPPFNFPAPGSTALAIRCCTSTTSHRPRSSSIPIRVSSIMSLSAAAAPGNERHLSEKGVPYHVNQVPNSARWQIFLRDPNNSFLHRKWPGISRTLFRHRKP